MLEANRIDLLGKLLIVAGVVCIASAVYFWQTGSQNRHQAHYLQKIQQRGYLKCGVASNRPGLSVVDTNSIVTAINTLAASDQELTLYKESTGLESDMCRAVAIGLFGATEGHLYFKAIDGNWNTRMNSVIDGSIDILFRQTGVQPELGSTHQVDHGPVVYFERIVLMTPAQINSADDKQLSDKRICAITNSFSEDVALDYSARQGHNWTLPESFQPAVTFKTYTELLESLQNGLCDAIAGRFSTLQTININKNMSGEYQLLSLANTTPLPTVAVVPIKAWQLRQLAIQSVWTLLRAEVSGQTSESVQPAFNSLYWQQHGLDADYPRRIIQQLGNYSQIYQQHLGTTLPDAGPNTHYALTSEGRLIAPK